VFVSSTLQELADERPTTKDAIQQGERERRR
jgi:hypothetical protein